MKLAEYVMTHTERGACCCGRCVDAPDDPTAHQPDGHTADMHFFKVSLRDGPDADTLRELIASHQGECDPLDGKEHSYMELGGWLGDQGLALQFMGMGSLLGLWNLLTPATIMPGLPAELAGQMAGAGMVSIQAA